MRCLLRLPLLLLVLAATFAPCTAWPKLPWQKRSGRPDGSSKGTSADVCGDGSECGDNVRPSEGTCTDAAECASKAGVAPPAKLMKPGPGQFIVDPGGHLSADMLNVLNHNLTKFNSTTKLLCYLAIPMELPKHEDGRVVSPRDYAKRLLREWFERTDKAIVILLVPWMPRMEVALGGRAKRKMKDSAARRIARKVQPKLAGSVDVGAQQAVKEITQALTRDKGFVGSLRSVLMPVIIVLVLVFMYMKNRTPHPLPRP
jgi:hypothetical protein